MLPNPNHTEDAGLTWDLGPGSTLPGENREKTAKLHKALVLLHLPHLQSGSPVFPPRSSLHSRFPRSGKIPRVINRKLEKRTQKERNASAG